MKRTLIIILLFLSIGTIGCKSAKIETTTTIKHKVDSNQIIHTTETYSLPVRNITVIENPCKDSLNIAKIDETLIIGNITVTAKNDSAGDITLTVDKPKDSVISVDSTKVVTDVKETNIDKQEIIIKYKVPKIFWIFLALSIGLNIWAYRKVIFGLVRKTVTGI